MMPSSFRRRYTSSWNWEKEIFAAGLLMTTAAYILGLALEPGCRNRNSWLSKAFLCNCSSHIAVLEIGDKTRVVISVDDRRLAVGTMHFTFKTPNLGRDDSILRVDPNMARPVLSMENAVY